MEHISAVLFMGYLEQEERTIQVLLNSFHYFKHGVSDMEHRYEALE